MALGQHKHAVGVFSRRQDAEQALHELQRSGFPMHKVSIIARDAERQADIAGVDVNDSPDKTSHSGNKADEGVTAGALTGGALGGIAGLLVGLGSLAIPGVGPIVLAGEVATALATTAAGGAIGAVAGGLVGGLIGLGIPEAQARVYSDRVSQGDYLIIVNGTDGEIDHAEAILNHRGIEEFGIYERPEVDRGRNADATATPTSGVTNRDLLRTKNAVGFFSNLRDAEQAINQLKLTGFPLNQVSLIGQSFEQRQPFTGIDVRDRFEAMRLGLPTEHGRYYNDRVMQGEYAAIINGTEDEIQRALFVLSSYGLQEWQIYDPTVVDVPTNRVITKPNSEAKDYESTGFAPAGTDDSVNGHQPNIVIVDRRDKI